MKQHVLKFSQLFESYGDGYVTKQDRESYRDSLWAGTEHGSMRGQEEYISDADAWDSLISTNQKYSFLLNKGIPAADIIDWLSSDQPKDEWLSVKRYFGI
jgi:hypothetical protein